MMCPMKPNLARDRKLLPTHAQMQQINNLLFSYTEIVTVKMGEYQSKKLQTVLSKKTNRRIIQYDGIYVTGVTVISKHT